jgi:uncharacterized protein with PIN domain
MRLLCDAMLAGLARWLRAAGYDTALVAPGRSDLQILDQCRVERRLLITRDRRLAGKAAGTMQCVRLDNDDLDTQARVLRQRHGMDWLHAPFTRCLLDNAPLQPASDRDLMRVPPSARGLPGPFQACPDCGRVFWPGSHVRRMKQRLQSWQALNHAQTHTPPAK